MSEETPELKCPLCDFRPRTYENDDPKTAKGRIYDHLYLKHHKGEIIRAILILAGWEEKK